VKLSRERKRYVALLGLGLAALAGDRLFFAPSGAEAAPAPSASEPQAAPKPTAEKPTLQPAAAAGPSFVQRTRQWADKADPDARDPFKAGDQWPRPRIKDEEKVQAGSPFEAFLASHKLKALTGVKGGSGPAKAWICGPAAGGRPSKAQPYGVDELVDSFRVVSISDENYVELEAPNHERYRLTLGR
jgi:hypothetical protein